MGKSVTAKGGVSLYDVISSTGKIIPAMCYHYTFDPFGSCGMCLVMQEGKKAPVRSCTAKATAGMIIRTEGDDLFQARKKAVEKHLSVHPLDCPVCDADGHCELQDMAFRHGVTNLANAKQKFIPEDTRSPVLDFNMNRCIACAECINVCKDVLMIDALQFMKKGGFNQVVPKGDLALSCEFCGDCLAVCPVGAITNKFSKYLYKPWQMKKTTTTCNYCGDGCQMYLETKDAEVVRVTSPLSWKNKWGDRAETAKGHGGLCVRGRFGFEYIDSPARLKQPLLRKGNQLVETPWLETMHQVVDRFSEIRRKHGPDAIAGLITARCTNEELYLFQKLMRAGFRTNHLDSSARYGHLNYVLASRHALGIGRSPNDWEDLTKAKAVILIGSNITETNPLTAVRIKEAIRVYKAQVVVIDSTVTNMAKLASHPVLIKPGTEGLVIDGLVKATLELDLIDEDSTKKHPQAFKALKAAVAHVSLEQVAAHTGMSVEALKDTAAIFAEASAIHHPLRRRHCPPARRVSERLETDRPRLDHGQVRPAWLRGEYGDRRTERAGRRGHGRRAGIPSLVKPRSTIRWLATVLPRSGTLRFQQLGLARISSRFSSAAGAARSAPSMSSEKTRLPHCLHRWKSAPRWIDWSCSSSRIRS